MTHSSTENLKIGDSTQLKKGFITSISLIYAGMPNEDVFSLAVTTTVGHMGMAYNLYLPTSQRHVEIAGVPVTVQSVSPTNLQLELH